MNSMNLYLCGLIGTGKTSIGKEIARRILRPFYDMDRIMEKEAGKRINDIVAEEGWVSYRLAKSSRPARVSRISRDMTYYARVTDAVNKALSAG